MSSDAGSVVAYNFFVTTWTRSVTETIFPRQTVVGLEERVFGDFALGPGQKSIILSQQNGGGGSSCC